MARPTGEPWPPRVLVAAHYDSFVGSPGAHDNASGSAAMGLVARRMAAAAPGVGFAAFDAEEWNKLGAERHAAALEQSGRLTDVRLMINVDSVGVGEHLYVLASPGLGEPIEAALRSAGATVRGGAARLPSGRWVFVQENPAMKPFDAWPFMRRGVPAVQIGSLGDRPFDQWHQPGDSVDGIGEAGRKLIADAAGVVEALARAEWR
ncbi:MAG TPA: M28 family peptidase [Humisphaera sp.]